MQAVEHPRSTDFVRLGERERRIEREPPVSGLGVHLQHDGRLDRARRRKPAVGVDVDLLTRQQVRGRDAHDPFELTDLARDGIVGRRSGWLLEGEEQKNERNHVCTIDR